MDCPAALWLSRTDVSCDKRSCRCHPRRADTLHTLHWLPASPSLCHCPPTPPPPPSPSPRTLFSDAAAAVPKWISNERICQGLFAAGLDLMLLLCRRSGCRLRYSRAAGGRHLPQVWPGNTDTNKELKTMKEVGTDLPSPRLPPAKPLEQQQSLCDSLTRPCFQITKTS